MKQLLKGGIVVSGSGAYPADVLIENETITAVGNREAIAAAAGTDAIVTNVTGRLLLPGFIDAHTHLDIGVAGTVTADDFNTGTKAAIRGGTTTIVDFATQYPGETLAKGLSNWHAKADGKSSCDYGFHLAITDWTPAVKAELPDMMKAGVSSFKLYMTYDTKVSDKEIFEIISALKDVGGIAGVHCESDGMIAALQAKAVAAGAMGVASHPGTRPAAAEAEAVDSLLHMAREARAPVIVVHVSTKEACEIIYQARQNGQEVYAETCPQYLFLDDHVYDLPGFEGAKYVCAPPLRKKEDQKVLWQALESGTIQTVSTDHCSFTMKQKELGLHDFRKIPGGVPGLETRGVLMYNGVAIGRLSLTRYCQVLSENPARLYGMYPKKGVIAPGSDADIVVLQPDEGSTIHAADLIQNVEYTPYENMNTAARIEQVYLRGTKVVEEGKILATNQGKYVARKKHDL